MLPAKTSNGFSLIELCISIGIIAVLASIAVMSFHYTRQHAAIAACVASAQSIQTSLITYSSAQQSGSFPTQISTWKSLVRICNSHGSKLPGSAQQAGFQDWVSYIPTDIGTNGTIDNFTLLLRPAGIAPGKQGAQIKIIPGGVEKQIYQ